MLSKKKMATIAATGVLSVGLLVGGASFALFTDTTANSGNSFEAGTLTLSEHRHDVPIEGPMFYQNDSDAGRMGTGLWAPLDSHTRAMFIKNTGSLDGKITSVEALPTGSASQEDVNNFAAQSLVTIAVLEAPQGVVFDDSVYEAANRALDSAFKAGISYTGWFQDLVRSGARITQGIVADEIREYLNNWKFDVDGTGHSIRVTDLYVGPLKDLIGGKNVLEELVVKSGDTAHLGYTVTLLDHENNNLIKNKTIEFNFKTHFEQDRNN